MRNLRIIKAVYYVPEFGIDRGTNVTKELLARIINDKLFYDGIYNRIFPDNFVGRHKRLMVDVKYRRRRHTKFYDENEKINLPNDLGEIKNEETQKLKNKWYQKWWIEYLVFPIIVGLIVGLIIWLITG